MRKIGLILAAAAVTVSLAGCSMIPGLGAQSGVQACTTISNEMTQASNKLRSALSDNASDPAAAAKAMDQMISDFSAARGKVTNAGVGAAMDKVSASLTTMSGMLKKAGDDPSKIDSAALQKSSQEVQTAFSELASACTKF